MIAWNDLDNEERRRLIDAVEMGHDDPQTALNVYNEAQLIHGERAARSAGLHQMVFDFALPNPKE